MRGRVLAVQRLAVPIDDKLLTGRVVRACRVDVEPRGCARVCAGREQQCVSARHGRPAYGRHAPAISLASTVGRAGGGRPDIPRRRPRRPPGQDEQ